MVGADVKPLLLCLIGNSEDAGKQLVQDEKEHAIDMVVSCDIRFSFPDSFQQWVRILNPYCDVYRDIVSTGV
jgi:hypothetical protein